MGLWFGPIILIPSALGWWIGGYLLRELGPSPASRAMLQGAVAGLVAIIVFGSEVGFIAPIFSGLPIGAFFGWLVCRRIWPNLPAPALR